VVVALAVTAGCSSDHSPPAIAESGLGEPGTPLGDGFRVPDGTVLLGGLFPATDDEDTTVVDHWSADLLITGSMLDAQEALKRQALDAGLEVGAGCDRTDWDTTCSLAGRRVEDGFVREALNIQLQQTPTLEHGYTSHGTIRYVRLAAGAVPDDGAGLGGAAPLTSLPEPATAPDPPVVGEPVAEDQVNEGNPDVVVAEGSEVIAPVRTYDDCTGGFTAHLRIPGDPTEVIADYRSQLDSWSNFRDGDPAVESTFRGHDTLVDSRYASGGGDLTLEVVYGEGGDPTIARLSRCGD
jgi:hypothetical protein